MNWYKFSTIIAAIISFAIGGFVYFKNRRNAVNISFALLSLSIASWCFSSFLIATSKDPYTAIWYGKIFYVPVICMPPIWLFLIFSIIGGKIKKTHFAKKLFISSLFLTPLFIALDFSNMLLGSVSKKFIFANYFLDPGMFYFPFIIFWTSYASYGFIKLFMSFMATKGYKRYHLKYFFIATLIGCFASIIYFAMVYGIKIIPIADSIIILYLSVMAYSIVRYRLLDINIVLTRAGIFVVVYTLVLGLPFIIGGMLNPYISKARWIIPVMIGIILASLGPFIYMRLQRRLESRLRAQEFKSHEALRRLSHNMLRFTNLTVLLKLMVHYLVKILKLRFAAIYLFDSQSNKYLLNSSWHSGENIELPQEFENNTYLTEYLQLRKLPLVIEELSLHAPDTSTPEIKNLSSTLSGLKVNTIIPCFLRSGLLGFLILSDRRAKLPFTQEDLNLLMVLSNEAALAIENAQFHQKETVAIVEKSKRDALADMAPGVSHQFNNRLASISSAVELLLLKLEIFNKETPQDENTKAILKDAKEALEMIDSEVYKGKEITSAILKRAKAKVEFQNIDIKSIIENAYKLVLISRTKSGINMPDFKISALNEIPLIFGSEALLQDCSYNFMDNGIDAIQDRIRKGTFPTINDPTYKGLIEVTLRTENGFVEIKIKDNGTGIKKEDMKKLFTPYFTTKATSDKGTGLGLYIIRDFIEMHKGVITCDSEYGKGTTFTIRIPIKNS